MEDKLSEYSSLQLIESMINKAKNQFSESGTLYLVWGIVIFICSMAQFIGIHFYGKDMPYVWFITWLVVIYQFIYIYKKRKREKVKTYTDDIIKYVWISFMLCMIVMIFILVNQKAYLSINPAILVLYGLPTFLTGVILKFRPLIAGGLCCWLLAFSSVFAAYDYQLLFLCAAVLLAWIIPGFLLRKKYLNRN